MQISYLNSLEFFIFIIYLPYVNLRGLESLCLELCNRSDCRICGHSIIKHFVLSGCLLYISWVNLRVAPINPQGAHYLSDCSSIACVEVDRDLWAPHARYLKSKNTFIWLWERCNFSSTSLQAAAKLLFLVGQHLKLIPTQHAIPT